MRKIAMLILVSTGLGCTGGFKAQVINGGTSSQSTGQTSSSAGNGASPAVAPAPAPMPAPAVSVVVSGGPATTLPTTNTPTPSSAVPMGAKLTFNDAFNTISISGADGADTKWFSQRIQCCMYDTSHPSVPTQMAGINSPAGQNPFSLVPGGGLDIRLQKNNGGWYSGVLATVDNQGKGFSQQYGYFEIRAKFPRGEGTWPAFWMVNTNQIPGVDPGEIDIFETYSILNYSGGIVTTMHDWSPAYIASHGNNSTSNPGGGPSVVAEPNLYDGFHNYGMLWTADVMNFYYDNVLIYSMPTQPEFRQPYFMIMDLGIGGGWPTTSIPDQNDMIVEFVRAYSLP